MLCWLRLISNLKVHADITDYCQDGKPWRKRTQFVSVHLALCRACRLCTGHGRCSRTHRPHVQLRGQKDGIKLTLLAEPYPYQLCKRLVTEFANSVVALQASSLNGTSCRGGGSVAALPTLSKRVVYQSTAGGAAVVWGLHRSCGPHHCSR